MPKRKHRDKKQDLKRKIRRLENRLNRYLSSDYTTDEENEEYERYYDYPDIYDRADTPESNTDFPVLPLSDSENSVVVENMGRDATTVVAEPQTDRITSVVIPNPGSTISAPLPIDPMPSTSTETTSLPSDILEALGNPKGQEEVFGPKIPEEISKRWGRTLLDGLSKETKQEMTEKYLIPDNFRLAKAPLLNPEIIPVISEPARHRDKLLEKSQNQLGLGISELTNLASTVIEGNLNKIELLKKISDISQIFLDLHYEDTKRRRKLVTSSLDKKFMNMISDVKRDKYLFGADLGEKIKASKTAERSGLQIKRSDGFSSTHRKYPVQGNWRGPPRTHAQRARRQGGPRGRYLTQQNRRPPPGPDRQPRGPAKMTPRTRKA